MHQLVQVEIVILKEDYIVKQTVNHRHNIAKDSWFQPVENPRPHMFL